MARPATCHKLVTNRAERQATATGPRPIASSGLTRRTLLLGGLAALALAPGRAQPAPRLTLRYGGDADFAPFESLDAQGRPQGFQVELLAALAEVLPIEFETQWRPWPQTEADFRARRVDLVAMVDTRRRREWAAFTRGHATPALGLYRRQSRPPLQGLHDLAGLRVAVLDGEAMRDTLERLPRALGAALPMASPREALAAVREGRADAALLPHAYADPLLADASGRGLAADHVFLELQTYAFAIAPDRQDVLALLQQGLDTLERNGRLDALRGRWLSSHRDLARRQLAERDLDSQRHWTWGLGAAGVVASAGLGALAERE